MIVTLLIIAAALAAASASPGNCSIDSPSQGGFDVELVSRDATALLANWNNTNGTSDFNFNFNPAYFPAPGGGDGIVVRVVECADNGFQSCPGPLNVTHPEWSDAGAMVIVHANLSAVPPTVEHISLAGVTWAGSVAPEPSNHAIWGAVDPRMAFHNGSGTYFLTWDNCTKNCVHRQTMLSTTRDPFDPNGWSFHGPIYGGQNAGVSLLLPPSPPFLAFVSNYDVDYLAVATSQDGIVWNKTSAVLMSGRPGCWDEPGVGAGPQALPLSSGDWLYIYNVDTRQYQPPLGRCAAGWAILDRDDPTRVLARAAAPLLTSVLPWEECLQSDGKHGNYTCQTTRVVWAEGLRAVGGDAFDIVYGGGDTNGGIARIQVTVPTNRRR
jgi:predicted GH43/DUF377 family glycosyl hydrolase